MLMTEGNALQSPMIFTDRLDKFFCIIQFV